MNRTYLRRSLVMLTGLFLLGLGIALFKLSLTGNDPYTAAVFALSDSVKMTYTTTLLIVNAVLFLAELLFGKKYIGLGTFGNWFLVGYFVTFWLWFLETSFILPKALPFRILYLLAGILILSLGASMYQTADLGISPYDVLSIVLAEKTPLPYFWSRIITDFICAVITVILHGLIGIGTVICVIGLGPFIAFFNRHVSEKLCKPVA